MDARPYLNQAWPVVSPHHFKMTRPIADMQSIERAGCITKQSFSEVPFSW
jgi:hypothetical protein